MGIVKYLFAAALALATVAPALAFERGEVWTGTYTYSDGRRAVQFTVFITNGGNHFEGVVVEPNTFGNGSSQLLYADIVKGEEDGDNFSFTKIYDGTGGADHGVFYRGRAGNGVANGTWQIGNQGGTFALTRR